MNQPKPQINWSNHIPRASMGRHNGYGYATFKCVEALESVGYTVTESDSSAPVHVYFDQPGWMEFDQDQYNIAYHPWESTELQPGWRAKLNSADEVWTPSPLIAEWYANDGIRKPIYVYEHGVDEEWTTVERQVTGPIKFLHVGGEASRKGMAVTLRAFRAAFEGNNDVHLTLKIMDNTIGLSSYGKVRIVNGRMNFPDLVKMHHEHHVFVYPTAGEGFGFNPIQAMATGMPTLTTGAVAPYRQFVIPELDIDSTLQDSPWPEVHPGKMMVPDFDSVVDSFRWAYDNYDLAAKIAVDTAPEIKERYNWNTLTKNAFGDLENRL